MSERLPGHQPLQAHLVFSFLTAEFLNPAEGIAEPGDGMTLFSTHTVASPTSTSFSSCSDAETGCLLQQMPPLVPTTSLFHFQGGHAITESRNTTANTNEVLHGDSHNIIKKQKGASRR